MSTTRDNPHHLAAALMEVVAAGGLPSSPEHPCPYVDDELAKMEGFAAERLPPETYHVLMDYGFRRSGRLFYRPVCLECSSCVPLRIPVTEFQQSRSQRRVWRRNADLVMHFGAPFVSDEKYELYCRYLAYQHPGSIQSNDRHAFEEFLYSTSVKTLEVTYRTPEGRLLAVSLVDTAPHSLSSVYHYFEPDESARSLGVFSVLAEIALASRWGVPYYYLGYWIAESKTMGYKASYYPHELRREQTWMRCERPSRG